MNFPKLKNPLLCQILLFTILFGSVFVPIILYLNLSFLPNIVREIILFGMMIGLLIYMLKNFALLFVLEILLARVHCAMTARKRFVLPRSFSVQKAEKKISRFGTECQPLAFSPRPAMLRYQSKAPVTIYSCGIEKVIASYHVDFLDKNQYHMIFNSAMANSNSLKGRKRHRFLDKSQKRSPLNRATVIVIYAKQVDEKLRICLFDMVCKNGGRGLETSVLPCVVDLEKGICTFDSVREPYLGMEYPAKNRGIKLIRKYLFDNRFPFADSPDKLDLVAVGEQNLEQESLWSLWRALKKTIVLAQKENKKRFQKMRHRETVFEDGFIYVKWHDRGIIVPVEQDDERRVVEIEAKAIDLWDYPKNNKIAKDTAKEIRGLIHIYFAQQGFTVRYTSQEQEHLRKRR